MNELEREEQDLDEQLENGDITQREHTRQMNELYKDYRAKTEEAAQKAYDDEMRRW